MKRVLSILAIAFATLLVIHTNLHAQVLNTVAITATAQEELGTLTVGGVSRTPTPLKLSITTKSILSTIALINNLVFPAGTKLVALQTFGSAPTYFIYNKANVQVLNVSSIMTSGRPAGNNILIHSGSFFTSTQLGAPSQTNYEFYVYNYNDGLVSFNLFGQMTHTRSDTKPNINTLLFSESQTNKTTAMAGSGSATGHPIVVTGTLSYSGKTILFF